MKYIFLFAFTFCLNLTTSAQTPGFTVTGDGIKLIKFTLAELTAMKQQTIKTIGHDQKEHTYTGVLLWDILKKADDSWSAQKHKTTNSYVVLRATDNYKTLLALAELDPEFTDKKIIVADKVDGKPLPTNAAPFQVIVPGEKKHGRWIRQLTEIIVVQLP